MNFVCFVVKDQQAFPKGDPLIECRHLKIIHIGKRIKETADLFLALVFSMKKTVVINFAGFSEKGIGAHRIPRHKIVYCAAGGIPAYIVDERGVFAPPIV